ncbi:unnamed protein product [Tilletia controversa]|uniref:Uncharacterized protein n=2 Tax=Tilletia TaxID=13289 RepID=A0A177UIF3_9BASI|nr:hypothetical protein CF328_g3026 [Tilletia controversa]KAE8205051.1 hypothetical protein CF335_g2451 [Tilletia laevis]KAE8262322.1 hypothetical protein A4X03_0g2548 [Tilletia caries]CAD6887422.1 unnamed protein product [Tilletia caries]CAD6905905.1 unnamed protein product [Tilletia caries]
MYRSVRSLLPLQRVGAGGRGLHRSVRRLLPLILHDPTPCEDMAAAREEEARQKQGGWVDEPMRAGAEDESMDVLPPLGGGGGMGMDT